MRKYYRDNDTKEEYVLYSNISNGVILTKFNERTGTPYGDSSYQGFVSNEALNNEFTEFKFTLDTTSAMQDVITKSLPKVVEQMVNYGIHENSANSLKDFVSSYAFPYDMYKNMVTSTNVQLGDYSSEGDDLFDFQEAEEVLYFLNGGLVPILKKMLIEYDELIKREEG